MRLLIGVLLIGAAITVAWIAIYVVLPILLEVADRLNAA